MATQQQRSEATRAQLLKAFRHSFLKLGYEGTTTQQVLAEVGLSKGAMYHHFRGKSEIIQALYEDEVQRTIGRAAQAVDRDSPALSRLKTSCLSWLREVRKPDVAAMLFEIGPSALGQEQARAIEDKLSLRLIEGLVNEAVTTGQIAQTDTRLIAAMINGLVAEAALHTLRTGKESVSLLETALDALFAALQSETG